MIPRYTGVLIRHIDSSRLRLCTRDTSFQVAMVEEIVGLSRSSGSGFRSHPVLIFVLYLHMNYCMYPLTLIVQLTILFGTSCGKPSRPRSPRLHRSEAGEPNGLGVTGRRS